MKNVVTPLSVGLLTVIALGFLVWGALRVKKGLGPGAKSIKVWALFKDAHGLGPRTSVVLAGVNVGQVDTVELAGDKARVTLAIREDTGLKQDATVMKRQASVLGQYFLELTPGFRDPPLRDGDPIRNVVDEIGINEVLKRLGGVAGTVDTITRDIQKVTHRIAEVFGNERGAGRMREILDNTAEISRKINQAVLATTGKLNRILDNFRRFSGTLNQFTGDTAKRVKGVLADVGDIARSVKGIVESSRGNIKHNFGQVTAALDGAKTAVDTINRSLSNVEAVTKRVEQGQGLLGQLTTPQSGNVIQKSEKLIERTTDVVDNLGETFEGVGNFLAPLVRLQPIFDLHTEVAGLTGKVKNYVGLRLQPAPDKYYLIELVDDPRGKTSFVKTVRRSTSSRDDPVVVEDTSVTENKLKFSLMLAKQFVKTAWDFGVTARFGIKESSGGIGFDFSLPYGFEVQVDMFDFIGDDRPRFKTWAMWHFAKYFYLAAGGDDLLNAPSRDFFVSLGLRFTDDDLKSILLVAPRGP